MAASPGISRERGKISELFFKPHTLCACNVYVPSIRDVEPLIVRVTKGVSVEEHQFGHVDILHGREPQECGPATLANDCCLFAGFGIHLAMPLLCARVRSSVHPHQP